LAAFLAATGPDRTPQDGIAPVADKAETPVVASADALNTRIRENITYSTAA
jgi:hypothetical protein